MIRTTAGPVTLQDVRVRTRSGEIRTGNLSSSIVNLEGEVHFLTVMEDTTESKQAEQAVRQGERLSALGTLATGIAHEINNPVGSATLAAEIALAIKDSPDESPQLEQCLKNIATSMDRCGQIVKNMLVFSLDKPSEKEAGQIEEAIRQSCHLTQAYALKHQTTIELALDEPLPRVSINLLDMELVMINLLRNAIEATGTGGHIIIRGGATDGKVWIAVEDNGRGMSAQQQKHIFDPFYTTRQDQGGTGLGCSIVYGIVKDHGGAVQVQSVTGKGTTITVTLPSSGDSLQAGVESE